jgi:hypothetical protein
MPVNEEAMMAADMIGFMESVVYSFGSPTLLCTSFRTASRNRMGSRSPRQACSMTFFANDFGHRVAAISQL